MRRVPSRRRVGGEVWTPALLRGAGARVAEVDPGGHCGGGATARHLSCKGRLSPEARAHRGQCSLADWSP